MMSNKNVRQGPRLFGGKGSPQVRAVCMFRGGEQGRAVKGTGWGGGDGWVTEAGPSPALIMPHASSCISKHILYLFIF